MKHFTLICLIITLIIAVAQAACANLPPAPNVKIYGFPSQDKQAGTPAQPVVPAIPPPQPTSPKEEFVERKITVDMQNSAFSIGIPGGYREKTEVIADKPLDIWFEYLPAEARLTVNGTEAQRDTMRWETKIQYTKSVTRMEYQITNPSKGDIAYYLRMVPSNPADKVPVTIRQRWIP